MLTNKTIPESEVKALHHVEIEAKDSSLQRFGEIMFTHLYTYSEVIAGMKAAAEKIQRVGFSMQDVESRYRAVSDVMARLHPAARRLRAGP